MEEISPAVEDAVTQYVTTHDLSDQVGSQVKWNIYHQIREAQ